MNIKNLSLDCKKLLKRALEYAKPYKLKLILLFLRIRSCIIFEIIQPLLWAKII